MVNLKTIEVRGGEYCTTACPPRVLRQGGFLGHDVRYPPFPVPESWASGLYSASPSPMVMHRRRKVSGLTYG